MKRLTINSLLTAFIFMISACTTSDKNPQIITERIDSIITDSIKQTVNEPIIIFPVDTFYNNLTQLIGGMDSIVDYENNWDIEIIKEYARSTCEKTEKIETNRLQLMSEWNASNLERNKQSDSSFVFYPFSGGDFIHLFWLYPNASEYLMVAREDVGHIPNLYNNDAKFCAEYLNDIDFVLRDIYHKSYFITKHMQTDTEETTKVDGMLPLILWAAAITNHEILSVKYADVNDSSQMVFVDSLNTRKKHDAVEIMMRNIEDGKIKNVTYLSCDISDKGFKSKSQYYNYLSNTLPNSCISFIKSASYLLHYTTFNEIRNLILEKSNFLVQDDTGIPFKYFDKSVWKVELCGGYLTPVKDFNENLYQEDLHAAYNDSNYFLGPINFSLGYHWGRGENRQNQMVITKIMRN